MTRGTKIAIWIVAVAVLAGLAGVAVQTIRSRRVAGGSALSSHVSEYAALAKGAKAAPRNEVLQAVEEGRLVAPVDVTGGDIRLDIGVYDAMPASARPLEDGTVTAVALLRYWEEEEKGSVIEYCQVTLIDRATGHIITTETLTEFTGPVRVGPVSELGELEPSTIAEFLVTPSSWQRKGFDLEPPPD